MVAYKSGISSMSLGRARVHDLSDKLAEACAQKFQGIELFYEDLLDFARSLPGGLTPENQLKAARRIRQMCDAGKLQVISLGPFAHYEGLLDREQHARKIEELKLWFQLIKILGTDVVQIPSTDEGKGVVSGDKELIVSDLREVAELGLKESPVVRFAYENLCWGTFVNTWEQAWNIVAAVDRPNFGICLDTFNIAGREWADPSSPSGTIPHADETLHASLERLTRIVDVRRVIYVQVVDAERMRNPVKGPGHPFFLAGHPPRMGWSRNARCFPFEEPGYLPIVDVLKAIVSPDGLGFRGWVSLELFSRTTADPDESCPAEHARRGMESWKELESVMLGWWESQDKVKGAKQIGNAAL